MRKRPVVNDNNIKLEPRILLLFAKSSKTKLKNVKDNIAYCWKEKLLK